MTAELTPSCGCPPPRVTQPCPITPRGVERQADRAANKACEAAQRSSMFDFYADDPEALKADLETLKTQARQAAEADAKYVPFATAAQQNADFWLGKTAEGGGAATHGPRLSTSPSTKIGV